MKTSDLYLAAFLQLQTKNIPELKLDAHKRIYFLFPELQEDYKHSFYNDALIPAASYVAVLKALWTRMFNQKEELGGFDR